MTIQEMLQTALSTVLRFPVCVVGSGRTDAGVHALAQMAHIRLSEPIDPWRLRANLNGILPKDIRIIEIQEKDSSFHARFSAQGKIYRYHFDLHEVQSPFSRLYSWHIPRNFDIDLARSAAAQFVGTHDFASFANEAHRMTGERGTVRTIYRIDSQADAHTFYFEFEGNGFLYQMVRNIVGFIADVAKGKRPLSDLDKLWQLCDRRFASAPAPAKGLFLVKVHYT